MSSPATQLAESIKSATRGDSDWQPVKEALNKVQMLPYTLLPKNDQQKPVSCFVFPGKLMEKSGDKILATYRNVFIPPNHIQRVRADRLRLTPR